MSACPTRLIPKGRAARRARLLAGVLFALAATVLAGCGGDDDEADPSPTAQADATSSTSTAGSAATTAAPATVRTVPGDTTAPEPTTETTQAGSGDDPVDIEDGSHVVYVSGIDVAARTLEFDLLQFLTGDEAKQAWLADNPGEPDGPPNDYYIVNDNPKLRTLPVSLTATVSLVRLAEDADADLDAGTWEELPAYFAAAPDTDGKYLTSALYRLTVAGGEVTAIEEIYVP